MAKTYVLRRCLKNMKPPMGNPFFKWPTKGPVEAPDWEPTPYCGHGLHGLLKGEGDYHYLVPWYTLAATTRNVIENSQWLVVEVDSRRVVDLKGKVKFPKGNVVFTGSALGALKKLSALLDRDFDEWIMEHPGRATFYALLTEPTKETQKAACKGYKDALQYAQYFGGNPTLRRVACKSPCGAVAYGQDVKASETTRKAACRTPKGAYEYSHFVDMKPTLGTYSMVIGTKWEGVYMEWFLTGGATTTVKAWFTRANKKLKGATT